MTGPRFARDGWDATTRVGVVVPHADVGPEAELGALAPPEVSVHGARLHFGAMRAGGVMDPTIPHQPVRSFTEAPFVDDLVELLAQSPLDVIALGFTSSAYTEGPDGERALIERLSRRGRGLPVVSTCLAATRALTAAGAGSLALVNPPWFDRDLDTLGERYFTAQGFRVLHHSPAGLPSSQTDIVPALLFDWIKSVAGAADAVFVAGNGQRAIGIIDALESELDITVLTANQVLFWDALRQAGSPASVGGYGRLFQL